MSEEREKKRRLIVEEKRERFSFVSKDAAFPAIAIAPSRNDVSHMESKKTPSRKRERESSAQRRNEKKATLMGAKKKQSSSTAAVAAANDRASSESFGTSKPARAQPILPLRSSFTKRN